MRHVLAIAMRELRSYFVSPIADAALTAQAEREGLADVFRAGGAAAVAAMAFGTRSIPAVDKIVGPGNKYVQLAKRLLSGVVGIYGSLGPSAILNLADDSAKQAAEMAQERMTVSTVAVGSDSDVAVLEEVAKSGQGRYYFTERSSETAMASDSSVPMSRWCTMHSV